MKFRPSPTVFFIVSIFVIAGCRKHASNTAIAPPSIFGLDTIPPPDTSNTWQVINTGIQGDIWDIWFTSPQKGFICTKYSIAKSVDSGKTWTALRNTDGDFNNISFLSDGRYGCAIGNDVMAYSSDSGNTWVKRSLPFKTLGIAIQLVTPSIAFARGDSALYKTKDAGLTWHKIYNNFANGFHFIDTTTGYLCAADNTLLKTDDGGNIWNFSAGPASSWYYTPVVEFKNQKLGWFMDGNGIMSTVDGGNTWMKHVFVFPLYDIAPIDDTSGYALDQEAEIFKTINGGNTWEVAYKASSEFLFSLYFLDKKNGWVCGRNSTILRLRPQ